MLSELRLEAQGCGTQTCPASLGSHPHLWERVRCRLRAAGAPVQQGLCVLSPQLFPTGLGKQLGATVTPTRLPAPQGPHSLLGMGKKDPLLLCLLAIS